MYLLQLELMRHPRVREGAGAGGRPPYPSVEQSPRSSSIKPLAKRFTKGINRFDVAYNMNGERVATEVVLNIQF